MKKFGKLSLALLVAASMVVAAGCDNGTQTEGGQRESVLYKSAGGDIISGHRVTGEMYSPAGPDYLAVTITIRKPNDPNTTIASGYEHISISGTNLDSVTPLGTGRDGSTYSDIKLENGIIYGNTIEYTVSGYYGSSSSSSNSGGTEYPSKTITFTKQ